MNYIEKAKAVMELEIQGLAQVRDSLDSSFDDAVCLFLDALSVGGKIVVTGIGKNLLIGEKISATLASTGATSVVLNPTQAMHGDLGMLSPKDALLALSYSGESDELVGLIPLVKRFGIRIVLLTGNARSTLAGASDVVVPVTVDREACPFNMAPTTSTTATLAVGDALAMVLLDARGFQKEDYAKLHPGGAIGRALLLKVSDIMRSSQRLAVVDGNSSVQDALVAMTRARSGSAAVVDEQRRLIGIFTDGDLRRLVAEGGDVLKQSIREVMTAAPLTVGEEQLAVDVLKIFEEHSVDDLLVVDDDQKVVGVIDIQDLPKVKIV